LFDRVGQGVAGPQQLLAVLEPLQVGPAALRSVQELLGHANISITHVYKQMRRAQLVPVP